MKNVLIILVFIVGLSYYFIPYDIKVFLLEKVWIDSSFLYDENEEIVLNKGVPVNLKLDTNRQVFFKWNIDNWIKMDLSWAALPYVKCFYPKDNSKFNWNVTLHRFYLPKNKNVEIKLIQDSIESKLSLYVYTTEPLSKVFPPEKEYVFRCNKNIELGLEKSVKINWNTAPTDVVIWVSWMNWIDEGGYRLEVVEK